MIQNRFRSFEALERRLQTFSHAVLMPHRAMPRNNYVMRCTPRDSAGPAARQGPAQGRTRPGPALRRNERTSELIIGIGRGEHYIRLPHAPSAPMGTGNEMVVTVSHPPARSPGDTVEPVATRVAPRWCPRRRGCAIIDQNPYTDTRTQSPRKIGHTCARIAWPVC